MIKTKADLSHFLAADQHALGKIGRPRWRDDDVWRFEIVLRKHEYYSRQQGVLGRMACRFFAWRHHRLGMKLGFEIPLDVFGPGLRINGHGLLIVGTSVRVGKNCELHQGVQIGINQADGGTVIIGDDCQVGPGAQLFNRTSLGDGVCVGANAVVNRPFLYDQVVIAGAPARIVEYEQTGREQKNLVRMFP